MLSFPWQRIILSILMLAIMIGSSGCQFKLGKDLNKTIDTFAHLTNHIVKAFTTLLDELSDISGALYEQIGNIIQNMTGP
jgi:hypothetical protein